MKSGLTGLEWAAGIPGTIGGAVRGNAGAPWGCMADCVESVKVLDIQSTKAQNAKKNTEPKTQNPGDLPVINYALQDCEFEYRNSVFKQNPNLIILSAELKLQKGDKIESEKRLKEILESRKQKQPIDFPSSGSFFKNPRLIGGQAVAKNKDLIKQFEIDTGKKLKDDEIPAGYILDRAGLREKRIGGAMVSEKHANFLMNAGKTKTEDFIILAAVIKTKVRNKFGLQLKEEVEMAGF